MFVCVFVCEWEEEIEREGEKEKRKREKVWTGEEMISKKKHENVKVRFAFAASGKTRGEFITD